MLPVTGRGDPQDAADRLDPETVTMLINKGPQDLVRRSSSAWAKYARARQDFVGLTQLTNLTLKRLDALTLFRRLTGTLSGVGLVTPHPAM